MSVRMDEERLAVIEDQARFADPFPRSWVTELIEEIKRHRALLQRQLNGDITLATRPLTWSSDKGPIRSQLDLSSHSDAARELYDEIRAADR